NSGRLAWTPLLAKGLTASGSRLPPSHPSSQVTTPDFPADDEVCPHFADGMEKQMKKLVAAFLVLVATAGASVAYAAEKVTVFAAASMKDVIEEAAKEFNARDGTEIVASFASSSVLAKQIEAGAP